MKPRLIGAANSQIGAAVCRWSIRRLAGVPGRCADRRRRRLPLQVADRQRAVRLQLPGGVDADQVQYAPVVASMSSRRALQNRHQRPYRMRRSVARAEDRLARSKSSLRDARPIRSMTRRHHRRGASARNPPRSTAFQLSISPIPAAISSGRNSAGWLPRYHYPAACRVEVCPSERVSNDAATAIAVASWSVSTTGPAHSATAPGVRSRRASVGDESIAVDGAHHERSRSASPRQRRRRRAWPITVSPLSLVMTSAHPAICRRGSSRFRRQPGRRCRR